MKETARYVSLNVRLLPQLIAALRDAEQRAQELNLLERSNPYNEVQS
jgi:hypothetical protein